MDEKFMETQVMELEMSIVALQQDVKAAYQRIEEHTKLTKSVHELALSVHDHGSELCRLSNRQEAMRTQLEALQARPAKHWNLLIGSGISALVGALIGSLAGR